MRNIIEQIIELYPNDTLVIAMESGNNVSGRAGNLMPNSNAVGGLFQLVNNEGKIEEIISICKIVSITITSGIYDDSITYLNVPTPIPTGCDSDCESAIRTYLPVETKSVSIKAGGQTVATGTVLKSEYGMVVIVGNNNRNPAFVSLCKTEIIKK